MGSARELRAWQDVDTARAGETSGWFAAIGVIVAVLGALLLLAASTARWPTAFDEVSQLSQAP